MVWHAIVTAIRIGLQHGMKQSLLTPTFGPTETKNSVLTTDTYPPYSICLPPSLTHTSSNMIERCGPSPLKQDPSCFIKSSTTLNLTGTGSWEPCPHPRSRTTRTRDLRNDPVPLAGTTTSGYVPMTPSSVLTGMCASTAPAVVMSKEAGSVASVKTKERLALRGLHPRYVRDMLWEEDRYPAFQASAELSDDTRVATLMPCPPLLDSLKPEYLHTMAQHPELFRIVTPLNVLRFKYLLRDHPNRAFVDSVVRSLREGAWPWAALPTEFP